MFLGVDGGGTKTAFVLIDQAGRILAQHQEGGAYYPEIGMEGTAAVLRSGTLATLRTAGVAVQAVRFAFFGLPAYGEDSSLQAALDALPSAFFPVDRYRCNNDMICSWSGSLACQDGISIIAGTGSIAYGEYANRKARAGGWGELFGDEGSAYWIAREGLALFSRMSDGRAPKGLLYTLIRERFALNNDLDLCAKIYGPAGLQRSGVAQLAKSVAHAALEGDNLARAIFMSAAQELVDIVVATRHSLAVPHDATIPVSYSGGVFSNTALVLEPFRIGLQRNDFSFTLTTPHFSPVMGAALYAAKCANAPLPRASLRNLMQQCSLLG